MVDEMNEMDCGLKERDEPWTMKCGLKEMTWNMKNEVDNVTQMFPDILLFTPFCWFVIFLNYTKKFLSNILRGMGFEPTLAEPNEIAVYRLNHSATPSITEVECS